MRPMTSRFPFDDSAIKASFETPPRLPLPSQAKHLTPPLPAQASQTWGSPCRDVQHASCGCSVCSGRDALLLVRNRYDVQWIQRKRHVLLTFRPFTIAAPTAAATLPPTITS
jgi:hypothetical protein